MEHRPVLLNETIELLKIRPGGSYVDCTFGRGGHTQAILDRLGPDGHLIAIDRDPSAIEFGRARFEDPRIEFVHSPFSALEQLVEARGLRDRIDGILMDLGVSSPQLDDAQRGFSFQHDGPLDMRMDPTSGKSVADWLKDVDERDLAECIRDYGEERHARRIARRICETRQSHSIETTGALRDLVASVVPKGKARINPATRTFQALRIFINEELQELRDALKQALAVLAIGARFVVIAFHSLEDRIVKRFFRDVCRVTDVNDDAQSRRFALPFKKPLRPEELEQSDNVRARSARLRVLERVA